MNNSIKNSSSPAVLFISNKILFNFLGGGVKLPTKSNLFTLFAVLVFLCPLSTFSADNFVYYLPASKAGGPFEVGYPADACDLPPEFADSPQAVGQQRVAKNNSVTGSACGGVCRNPAKFVSATESSVTTESLCTGIQYSVSIIKVPNPKQPPSPCVGNPCNPATGAKYQFEIDFKPTLTHSLSFTRVYNSHSLSMTHPHLGIGWRHSYEGKLEYYTYIDTTNSMQPVNIVKLFKPNGQVLSFNKINQDWIADADITETLMAVDDGWQIKTNSDTLETYNSAGQLTVIKTRDGKTTTLSYNAINQLETVTGPFGRTLQFVYDLQGRLSILTTPDNTSIKYQYDANNNLAKVIYPDSTPDNDSDNPRKIYHYEKSGFPHHLTGISDENGNRYATYAYNSKGKAVLSEHAGSAERVELVYNIDDTTTVTDALGRIETYNFETHYNVTKPASVTLHYNDGKQAVTKSKTYSYYPENGRVKEVTDYNGNTTYFEYNARGLVTLETSAKGTQEAYTVTTTWHLDYRLPETRTYPDRTETYSYDTNGLLINTQISSNP